MFRRLVRGNLRAATRKRILKTAAAFNAAGGSTCQYDPARTTDPFRPQWSASCFAEISNPANFELGNVDLLGHGLSAQLNLQITGAGAKRYHLGSRLATIEVGGRFRNAHKFDDSFRTNMAPIVSLR